MEYATIGDFNKIDIRLGKIVEVQDFPEARKPAYQLIIDFGDEIGIKKSSAQITDHYMKDDLLHKTIIAVTNFPPRQIGKFKSEVLVLGLHDSDDKVALVTPEKNIPLGARLC
jgi:tRNA-binding protein